MPRENLFSGGETHSPFFDSQFDALLIGVKLDTSLHTATFVGTATLSSAEITGITNTNNLQQGMVVTGSGIPANTTILYVGNTFIVLSNTSTSNGTFTFTAAMYLYTWVEQDFNANSGAAFTPPSARFGSQFFQPCYEIANRLILSPVSFTGTSHTSTTVDGISSTSGITIGMVLTGPGVRLNPPTYVTAVTSNSITISQATGSSTTDTFSTCKPLLVQMRTRTTVGNDQVYEFSQATLVGDTIIITIVTKVCPLVAT